MRIQTRAGAAKLGVATFSVATFGVATCSLLSATLLASAASAQVADAPRPPVQPTTQPTAQGDLDEIVVTATKRAQTLQEVPVAVSVVSAETIERAQVRDLIDLQTEVPSLRVDQLQSSSNTNFIIRGFGNGANNAGIEPSVGVFIDGVYRSRSAAQISDLPNIARVEVLRGPQSTLFGKNASAGIISIVTEAPRFEFGGEVEASYGNFDAVILRGDVDLPASDQLAFNLAAGINRRDGYIDDIALGIDTNERDRWYVRGQALYEPVDALSLRLIADYDRIDELCCAASNVINGPTGAAVFALGGALVPEDPFGLEVASNLRSTNDIENYGVSLQADLDLGESLTLTSITAYREVLSDTNQDSDFTSLDILSANAAQGKIETLTQELRLASNFNGPVNGIVGGYYFDEDIAGTGQLTYGDDFRAFVDVLSMGGVAQLEQAVLGVPIGTFQQSGQGIFVDSALDNQAWTVFGQVDFELSEAITLTGGISYTDDEKDFVLDVDSTDAFSGLDLFAIGSGVVTQTVIGQQLAANFGIDPTDPAQVAAVAAQFPAAFAAIQAGAQQFAAANAANPDVNPLLGLLPLQFLPPFLDLPNAVEDAQTRDDDVTYTARISFDVTPRINLYGSYATGFKASSVNLGIDSRPFAADFAPGSPVLNPPASAIRDAGLAVPNLTTGTRFAGPESSEVFEVGLKARFDDLAFNLTVFDQIIEGFQSNIFNGTGFELRNSGQQGTFGVEFDSRLQVTDGLSLNAAFTYLDPQFDDFVQSGLFDADGNEIDLSGTEVPGIPQWAVVVGGTYVHELGEGRRVIASANYAWEDEVQLALNTAGITREVEALNATLTFALNDRLSASLWGRNLTNDDYLIAAFPAVAQAGSFSGYPNQPRTYGVAAKFGF